MDLIDRYLISVRRHLPASQQQDIVEELADSLRSEAEDTEQRLGHPLSIDEQSELLKQRGHPWLMASRYLPQQYLVGPALYPYYRLAITIVLFWVVLPITLIGGALMAIYADNPAQAWGRVLGSAWNGAIYAIGIVTLVYHVLDSQHVRITALDRWNPSRLPEPQGVRAISRAESLFSLIFTITFLVVWTDLVRLPEFADYGGATIRFVPEPVWSLIYYPFVVSLLVHIATSFIDLIRPWRTPLISAVNIANSVAYIVMVMVLLRAGHWITVTAAPEFAAKALRADHWINLSIEWTLLALGFSVVVETLLELWRAVRGSREVVP